MPKNKTLKWLQHNIWHKLKSPLLPEEIPLLDDIHFVVLDIETTGLNPERDEVLAIGAIKMMGTRILVGHTFEQLTRPAQASWNQSVPIHRILPPDVALAPPLEMVLADFTTFCGEAVLVGHTVDMDRTFLTRTHKPLSQHIWLDTRRAAGWLAYRNRYVSRTLPDGKILSALAHYYNINIPHRHHALSDAFITAQIWQRQLWHLKRHNQHDLGHLLKIGQV